MYLKFQLWFKLSLSNIKQPLNQTLNLNHGWAT